jgi:predicted kinase
MEKPTVLLICGLPGSGKTTLAEKLSEERNALSFCPDNVIIQLLADRNNTVERDRLRDPVEKVQWKEAKKIIKLGCSVILENGFWTRKERERYAKEARETGALVELHYLKIPLHILKERIKKRNSSLGDKSFEVDSDELDTYLKWFEEPDKIEQKLYDGFFVYTS